MGLAPSDRPQDSKSPLPGAESEEEKVIWEAEEAMEALKKANEEAERRLELAKAKKEERCRRKEEEECRRLAEEAERQ